MKGQYPTLNIFDIVCKYIDAAFESFEEWNPDPEVAEAARCLYGNVGKLELYVRLSPK